MPHEVLDGAELLVDHSLDFCGVFDGLDLGSNTAEAQDTSKLQEHKEEALCLRLPKYVTVADSCRICRDKVKGREVDIHWVILPVLADECVPPTTGTVADIDPDACVQVEDHDKDETGFHARVGISDGD